MRRSPLQVETYFLRELSFSVNEDYDEEKPEGDLFKGFQYFTDFFCYDKASHKWQCVLGVRCKRLKGENTPYSFQVLLVGFFTVEGDIPSKDTEEKLVHANAPAVLYTVAREILSSTSARARWGRINLPTVYFPAVTSAEIKEEGQGQKPSSKKPVSTKGKKKTTKRS